VSPSHRGTTSHLSQSSISRNIKRTQSPSIQIFLPFLPFSSFLLSPHCEIENINFFIDIFTFFSFKLLLTAGARERFQLIINYQLNIILIIIMSKAADASRPLTPVYSYPSSSSSSPSQTYSDAKEMCTSPIPDANLTGNVTA
jgi:hypothetical protein